MRVRNELHMHTYLSGWLAGWLVCVARYLSTCLATKLYTYRHGRDGMGAGEDVHTRCVCVVHVRALSRGGGPDHKVQNEGPKGM